MQLLRHQRRQHAALLLGRIRYQHHQLHGEDYNNSNPNSGAGWAAGRFFVGSDLWGSQTNTYIADDTTIDMGVRPTYVYQNVGEQLLWEGQSPVGGGTFLAATANALTLKGLPSGVGMGYYAIIVSGDGVGEDDPITSYNASTGLITLAQPWTVTPDASSVIGIGEIFTNIVVYDNTLQGKGVTQTASTGVQFWGGAINCIIDSNTISNVNGGITDSAQPGSGYVIPIYFNLIENNTITNTQNGIAVWNNGTSGQIGAVGNIVRDNQINTASATAILSGDVDSQGSPFYVIAEYNTAVNVPMGVEVGPDGTATTYLFLWDDSFDLGSAAASGSAAVMADQGLVLTQLGNTFTGFEETYAGTVTPDIISATTQLVFVQQPTVTSMGRSFTPNTTVDVENANGTLDTADDSNVTLAIASGTTARRLAER